MRGFDPKPSPWRERPIEESLQLFEVTRRAQGVRIMSPLQDTKNGKFEESEATLRMKTTLEERKHDPVEYRIKFVPHHRSKDTWSVMHCCRIIAWLGEVAQTNFWISKSLWVSGASARPMTTRTVSATLSRTPRTHCAQRSSSPGELLVHLL